MKSKPPHPNFSIFPMAPRIPISAFQRFRVSVFAQWPGVRSLVVLWSLFLWSALPARAQWVTQAISLKAGWNAVYLHVDPSCVALDDLVGTDSANPILEVWLWAPPASTLQFVQSPQQPVEGAQWVSWNRNATDIQALQRLVGNSAYLVRSASNYVWSVKGKPLPPAYSWTTTGLNFLGFPTVPADPPSFDSFLSQAPDFYQNAEIYQYPGGELSATNPARVYALRNTKVNRGQAYWIRSGTVYNTYYAPMGLVMSGSSGVDYQDSLSVFNFRLQNRTANSLTVTLHLVASETPPAGQTNILGTPALLVQGPLNTTNLTYTYTSLAAGGSYSWTLPAQGQSGSDIQVVLGLDRTAMTGSVGALYAGVLRLTDSLGYSQMDLPVTAQVASQAGLWVGQASIKQVGQYLKTYTLGADNRPLTATNGQYVLSSVNTELGVVSRTFPMRLIVHNPEAGAGHAVLLQQVFVGVDPYTNSVVALLESALHPSFLSQARRISAVHLPWSPTNQCWSFDGALGQASNLTTSVTLDYADQASNPFLHTYHPDHDNLDTTFQNELSQGAESYTVRRDIRLTVVPANGGSATFNNTVKTLGGTYVETMTVLGLARAGGTNDTRVFQLQGTFTLNRISSVATLTRP